MLMFPSSCLLASQLGLIIESSESCAPTVSHLEMIRLIAVINSGSLQLSTQHLFASLHNQLH